jgi:hypothetical protein
MVSLRHNPRGVTGPWNHTALIMVYVNDMARCNNRFCERLTMAIVGKATSEEKRDRKLLLLHVGFGPK